MELADGTVAFLIAAAVVMALGCAGFAAVALNRHAELVALRTADRSFQELYNSIGEGVFRSTLEGSMLSANPALVQLNGFASEAEMLKGVNDIAGEWYVEPGRRAELHRQLLDKGELRNVVSEVYRYKTRERIWIEESVRLVRDERTGAPRYYEGIVREVTDAVRRQQDHERYEKITRLVPGFVYQHHTAPDGSTTMPFASAGILALAGVTREQAAKDGRAVSNLIHQDDREALLASYHASMKTMTPRQTEYRLVLRDGTEKWVLGQSVPEQGDDGSIISYGSLTDITEKKRAEQRIFDLAYRDTLTGLPNRAALGERLRTVLTSATPQRAWNALLFIDLDQFKVLNDTKGHHYGDQLLCKVAERLCDVVPADATIARLGGDEFVVVLKDLGLEPKEAELHARRVGERIHMAIAEPVVLDGFPFHTSASIGAALFRGDDLGVDELLKRADMAMYEAKDSGRGSIAFFRVEMQDRLEDRLALTNELRDALEKGDLTLAYQPQADDGGACFAVEALLRWNHPTRGAISPSIFVPLGEGAGLGPQIDAFVLATACETLARWRRMPAMRHLEMAVNISGQQVGGRLVALVTSCLKATGVEASRLMIELTEHVMLDSADEIDAAFAALKQLGVKIALDDFGTGYSSLSHLKRLPIDALKIDCSFVDEIETDTNDRVIVQTILNIARNLGVTAIAEGVENEMQALLLRRFGCRAFQGFMFGRPMSLEALEETLVTDDQTPEIGRPERLVI